VGWAYNGFINVFVVRCLSVFAVFTTPTYPSKKRRPDSKVGGSAEKAADTTPHLPSSPPEHTGQPVHHFFGVIVAFSQRCFAPFEEVFSPNG
jgi:hypothetical protein